MRIAFIGDQSGKVHHNRFVSMSKYMDMKFDFFTVKDKKLPKKCSKYDAIYYASYTMYKKCPLKHSHIYGSATSWKCIFGSDHDRDMRILGKFHKISANNLALAEELRKYRKDIEYIPNGVECDFFTPLLGNGLNSPIRIGWVGNKDRAEKNFHILRKIRKKNHNVQWKIVATSKSDSAYKLRTHKQMRDFYRTLDYFLVISSYEGTPNPALEAASCGIPLIATPVGNMPELIEEGVSGFFVQANHKSIVNMLNNILDVSNDRYLCMRNHIRKSIIRNWGWKNSCGLFSSFLSDYEYKDNIQQEPQFHWSEQKNQQNIGSA